MAISKAHANDFRQLEVEVLLAHSLAVEDGLAERLAGRGHALAHIVLVLLHLRGVLAFEETLVERFAESTLVVR
jgi:hypothetical protein